MLTKLSVFSHTSAKMWQFSRFQCFFVSYAHALLPLGDEKLPPRCCSDIKSLQVEIAALSLLYVPKYQNRVFSIPRYAAYSSARYFFPVARSYFLSQSWRLLVMIKQSLRGKVQKPPPFEYKRTELLHWCAFQQKTTFLRFCVVFNWREIENKSGENLQTSSASFITSMKHNWRQTIQVTLYILRFVKHVLGAHIRHTTTEQKTTFWRKSELFPDLVFQSSQIAKDN